MTCTEHLNKTRSIQNQKKKGAKRCVLKYMIFTWFVYTYTCCLLCRNQLVFFVYSLYLCCLLRARVYDTNIQLFISGSLKQIATSAGLFFLSEAKKKYFMNLAEGATQRKPLAMPETLRLYASQILPFLANINYILLVGRFLCSKVFNTDSCLKATLKRDSDDDPYFSD